MARAGETMKIVGGDQAQPGEGERQRISVGSGSPTKRRFIFGVVLGVLGLIVVLIAGRMALNSINDRYALLNQRYDKLVEQLQTIQAEAQERQQQALQAVTDLGQQLAELNKSISAQIEAEAGKRTAETTQLTDLIKNVGNEASKRNEGLAQTVAEIRRESAVLGANLISKLTQLQNAIVAQTEKEAADRSSDTTRIVDLINSTDSNANKRGVALVKIISQTRDQAAALGAKLDALQSAISAQTEAETGRAQAGEELKRAVETAAGQAAERDKATKRMMADNLEETRKQIATLASRLDSLETALQTLSSVKPARESSKK
jgi:chromosome segregation ATPase